MIYTTMGWLRLVGSLKLKVAFAEYRLFYRDVLRKRSIVLRSLLIVATPYDNIYHYQFKRADFRGPTASCGVVMYKQNIYCDIYSITVYIHCFFLKIWFQLALLVYWFKSVTWIHALLFWKPDFNLPTSWLNSNPLYSYTYA